jgi:CubicO group peptidase (beta-lactamase class C family)
MGKRHVVFFGLVLMIFSAAFSMAAEPALPGSLKKHVDKRELAGAVALVVDRDRVLFVGAVGSADIAKKQPMTPEALFWIASQTKAMTAACVLMLMDEGKLQLDDPLEKYLPEFKALMVDEDKSEERVKLVKPNRLPTIRQALSHTSGLPFSSEAEQPTYDALPLAEAVKSYAKTPLLSHPGTAYEYSNAGINSAARVIEVVSGQKYEDFLQKRLLDPLGMTETTFWPSDAHTARLAKSYAPNEKGNGLTEQPIDQLKYPLSDRKSRYPMPAGGLFSTAADVGKFAQFLLRGDEFGGKQLLSKASFTELTKRQTAESTGESYGLGLTVSDDQFGHGGAYATSMEVYPKAGIALVWMVQHAGFPGEGGNAQDEFRTWAFEKFAKPE